MKKLLYFETILIYTIIWVILNEKADFIRILTGIAISVFAIFFTDYYLVSDHYKGFYPIRPLSMIRYFVFLLFQIYKSGIASIRIILKGDTNVKMVDYESSLKDDIALCLLANAITLTPGTVTIEKSDNVLKILQFDTNVNSAKTEQDILLSKFEKILSGRHP